MIEALMPHMLRQTRTLMIAVLAVHLVPFVAHAMADKNIRVIDRDQVTLGDVFGDTIAHADTQIGPAPNLDHDLVLSPRALARLARAYGVTAPTTEPLTLRRAGTFVSPEQIEGVVRAGLTDRGLTGPYTLQFQNPLTGLTLPQNMPADLTITQMDYQPTTGTFQTTLATRAEPVRRLHVSGRVDHLIQIPVLRGNVARGQTLTAADLDLIETSAGNIKSDIALTTDELIGKVARKTLPAGMPLKSSDIDMPLSLKRGDKITLLYRVGKMELSAQGRAQEDGRTGARVRVINTASNKPLQGTVTGDHTVTID